MKISQERGAQSVAINELFKKTFAASEGPDEGRVIGSFVEKLIATTSPEDLFVFTAFDQERLLGAICFSRLCYPDDPRAVFLLSPVAVTPDEQRKGIGQRLISAGIETLASEGADYAITYGDPAYYAQTGFQPISESVAKAPLPLSMPQGWLGQPLSECGDAPFIGTPSCAPALNDPALW